MKKCPTCAEEVQDAALKCRYCGERYDRHIFNGGVVWRGLGIAVIAAILCQVIVRGAILLIGVSFVRPVVAHPAVIGSMFPLLGSAYAFRKASWREAAVVVVAYLISIVLIVELGVL